MASCVFCLISSRRQAALAICESDHFICFAPLVQEVPGHTIIASKTHYQSLLDAPASIGGDLIATCHKLAAHFQEQLGARGFNLLNANEAAAQQSVMHLHFHFLPRLFDDGVDAWPKLPGASQNPTQTKAAKSGTSLAAAAVSALKTD